MKNFIDKPTIGKKQEINLSVNGYYIEFEKRDEEFSTFLYLIPRTENSLWVAASLGSEFQEILTSIAELSHSTIVSTWPTLTALAENANNSRFSKGALIQMEDDDVGETKWFVASIVGNINFDSLDDLFDNDRLQNAMIIVHNQTVALYEELATRKPSIGKALKDIAIECLFYGAMGAILGVPVVE